MAKNLIRPSSICHYGNTVIFISLAIYFFLSPVVLVISYLSDPGLKTNSMSKTAFRLHYRLSPKYKKWALNRIKCGAAENLSIEQIAATEWPLFGSVFYLWATEALQQSWEQNKNLWPTAPNVYAAGAIEAAAALVTDPAQACWVKQHWGQDYLHKENVFYRMLLISGMTSYHKLLDGDKYLNFLRDQVESFSGELDKSPFGLLNDYPGQCYPTDIIAAIAAINRTDVILGTDHSEFVKRALRGFEGRLVDWTGLPPYEADSTSGAIGESRGCSTQWMTVWAPELWPDRAKQWYDNFEKHFWQKSWSAAGFREFHKGDSKSDWYIDVDSGPVIGGYGAAACAFGIGAARANGRFDHAYPLSIEVLLLSWPLPDGTLFGARFLSNAAHAPYLGEAAILYAITRMPAGNVQITKPRKLPAFVYIVIYLYLAVGIMSIATAFLSHKHRGRQIQKKSFPLGKEQMIIWAGLVVAGTIIAITRRLDVGLLLILLAQFLPIGFIKTPPPQR